MSIWKTENQCVTVGIISDTHGLIRKEALAALKDADVILHAGDIGKPKVLDELQKIAPLVAVRGNCDKDEWSRQLPETEVVNIGELRFYLIHNVGKLNIVPKADGIDAVVYGHSHKFSEEKKEGILYINPGSAGPKRFNLPITVALLHVNGKRIEVERHLIGGSNQPK
ncbi:metallophosphoesterase family protein [Heliobacterium chlorum]|uniref:metallophosphoesterase family protein n=1 Tax=Heliobacterium chlorum TaxID=2698 RepID=UPI001A9AFEEE|nr:metallophosphoesterase family protein [Heliobacterium chlorum]